MLGKSGNLRSMPSKALLQANDYHSNLGEVEIGSLGFTGWLAKPSKQVIGLNERVYFKK